MKKTYVFEIIIALFLSTLSVNAQQTENDFFLGKWNVAVTGTPMGNFQMTVDLSRKEGQLTGTVNINGYETQITSSKEEPGTISVFYDYGGNATSFTFKKKDEDHITGVTSGGYDANGERVK